MAKWKLLLYIGVLQGVNAVRRAITEASKFHNQDS